MHLSHLSVNVSKFHEVFHVEKCNSPFCTHIPLYYTSIPVTAFNIQQIPEPVCEVKLAS